MNKIYLSAITAVALTTLACGGANQNTANNGAPPKPNELRYSADQMPTPTPVTDGPTPTPAPQVRMTEDVPGISPSNSAQPMKPGTGPTPGIPSQKELQKPRKPGTTPTPGIPSEAEIKRMMTQPPAASNSTMKDTGPMMRSNSNSPMMKSNRPLGGRPQP